MRLENKIALLCGVGRGMGRAVALLYAQEGATVVINARTSSHLEKTAAEIESHGGTVHIIPGDTSNKITADQLVEDVVNKLGPIDILYSAAGGNFDPDKKTPDIDTEFWDQTIHNTLNSYFNVARSVHPIMTENGGGSVIAVAASFNVRQAGNAAYSTAKMGIIGLSKNLAQEFHTDNIRVNTILAGLFRGKLSSDSVSPAEVTLQRTGYPQDIAYAALFLASDESGWITGQTLAVDGGVDIGGRTLWEHER